MRPPDPIRDVRARSYRLALSRRTHVMGILNITPDSFSDGKKFLAPRRAIEHALRMARDGADSIDIGGESTRPGAPYTSAEEELGRVLPVVKTLAKRLSIPISIDTRKAEVASACVAAGASIINDVSGLHNDPRIASIAARSGAALILMHMRGVPATMQRAPRYADVMSEIAAYLRRSIAIARKAGVTKDRIIVDPGIGFGKTCRHNLEIIARLSSLRRLAYPVCIGVSRKAFIGKTLGIAEPAGRLIGTVAANSIALWHGARIIRVHDVREGAETARLIDSILRRTDG